MNRKKLNSFYRVKGTVNEMLSTLKLLGGVRKALFAKNLQNRYGKENVRNFLIPNK